MLKHIEKICKALGDKNRLRIIHMLSHRSLCVCEITSILNISQSTVSGHLRVLKEAGLVEDTKDGLWVEYSLNHENTFITKTLDLITTELQLDPKLIKEKELTSQTNREILCKK